MRSHTTRAKARSPLQPCSTGRLAGWAGFPPAVRVGGGREGSERGHFLHPGLPWACFKTPWGLCTHPRAASETRKLRLRSHQSRGETATPQPGNDAQSWPLLPTLLQVLKSPSSPPRARQQRLGEHPSSSAASPLAREWPPHVQAERRASRVLREGTRQPEEAVSHARTIQPRPPPPPRGRKSGGRRSPRAAEGEAGTSAASTSAR